MYNFIFTLKATNWQGRLIILYHILLNVLKRLQTKIQNQIIITVTTHNILIIILILIKILNII